MKANHKHNQPRPRGLGWLSAIVALALIASHSSAAAQDTMPPSVVEVAAYCPDPSGERSTLVLVRLDQVSFSATFGAYPVGGGERIGSIFSYLLISPTTWLAQFLPSELPPGDYELEFGTSAGTTSARHPFTVACENTPPTVVSVQPNDDGSRLTVTFSEPMDMVWQSAADPFNYSVDDINTPFLSAVGPSGFNSVELEFVPPLNPGPHILSIFNVQDLSGNSLAQNPTLVPIVVTYAPSKTISAVTSCSGTEVVVTYRDPVDPFTTADPFSYKLWEAPSFSTYFLPSEIVASPDGRTFTLKFTDVVLDPGFSYALTAEGIMVPTWDAFYEGRYVQYIPVTFGPVPPVVTCNVAISSLFPVKNTLVNVGLSATSSVSDLQVQVFSDEPEVGLLQDAELVGGVLKLRARRNPGSDGRVYLIVVTSTDPCGNTGVCCSTVVIPENGSAGALASVQAQAAAAQAQCSATGSPLTPYRILP